MIRYVKSFDSDKTCEALSYKVNDTELSKRYIKTWERVSNLMSIKFHSEPVSDDNDKHIKTKLKIYRYIVNINLQNKEYQKKVLHVNVYH